MNSIPFLEFILAIKDEKKFCEHFFVLDSFAIWNKKNVNVEIKFSLNDRHSNFTLFCKVPTFENWKVVYSARSLESLCNNILIYGLDKINEIFNECFIIYQIKNDISLTIDQIEGLNNTDYSYFQYANELVHHLKIWKFTSEKSSVTNRVGGDNLIKSEITTKYVFLIGRYLVKDEFLVKLLPKESVKFEHDSGYIPSSEENIVENANFDSKLTESILISYSSGEHYKYLVENQIRKVKKNDNKIYSESF